MSAIKQRVTPDQMQAAVSAVIAAGVEDFMLTCRSEDGDLMIAALVLCGDVQHLNAKKVVIEGPGAEGTDEDTNGPEPERVCECGGSRWSEAEQRPCVCVHGVRPGCASRSFAAGLFALCLLLFSCDAPDYNPEPAVNLAGLLGDS